MAKIYAITPTRAEAAYIRYRLALSGHSLKDIAKKLNCDRSLPGNICRGVGHAAKVEKAIAQACGFKDWNTMLWYIRSSSAPAGHMLPAA